MAALRIITWLWRQDGGRARYEPTHVRIWADMVRRHLSVEHTLAVVTDIAADFGDVDVIAPPSDFLDVEIPTWRHGRPRCHRRLALFRPDAADIFGAERIVSMDLDVVVCAALDPLFAGAEDFRICRGTSTARSFNGSMYMLRAGSRPEVYTSFTPQRAAEAGRKHVGSDQSWLAHCLGGRGEATWGPDDGVVPVQHRQLAKAPRLITWPGVTKPWHIAELGVDRLVAEHYRRTPRLNGAGTGLVLGYGATLWDDLAAALSDDVHGGGRRRFDAVIASPEAAPHWPGPLLAIANDDDHAERLAAMHGLADVVFCGRTKERSGHGAVR